VGKASRELMNPYALDMMLKALARLRLKPHTLWSR